jgi:hypothetical protein
MHAMGRSWQVPDVPQPLPAQYWVERQSLLLAQVETTGRQQSLQVDG